MSMYVAKKHLNRRTLLRAAGASLALPMLDGMTPAFAAEPQRVRRFATVYAPNGMIMQKWTPDAVGSAFDFKSTLEPLQPYKNRVLVLTGLDNKPANPLPGEGTGDHVRSAATFLTGAHPKKTEGPDIRAGVSMDQLAARVMGRDTQLPSLEVGIDANELIGACESGWSCAYANTLCWSDATTPLPLENKPRAVFERLFGDSENTTPAARLQRIREDRSVLDSLLSEIKRLEGRIGAGDRAKLDQYLVAIREIERRIQTAEAQIGRALPAMERPQGGIPATFTEHCQTMMDLKVLAFQSDMTRITTFMYSREVSARTYPEIGIYEAHHGLSHHGDNPVNIEKLGKTNQHHIKQLAYFMDKMNALPDGNGTLLDNVTILYGCGLSDGNRHIHEDLPILVVGGDGQLKGGRHVKLPQNQPMTNLQLALLDQLGAPTEKLGDSTGVLSI